MKDWRRWWRCVRPKGYMARLEKGDDGSLLLVEDHCPICAAAIACQGLCRSELDIFRAPFSANWPKCRAKNT